jgi:hypothetical protein
MAKKLMVRNPSPASHFRQQLKYRVDCYKMAQMAQDKVHWRKAGQDWLYIMLNLDYITARQLVILIDLFL